MDIITKAPGLFILASIVILTISCGRDEGPKIDPSAYADWPTYDYGHFHFIVSPRSEWIAGMKTLAEEYERFLRDICAMLEMPIPGDTITMYIYALGNEDREITGRKTPFSTDKEIHWADTYPYGYQLTKFLLARRKMPPGRFGIINEGIPFLLDFSGLNYHDKTNRRVNSGSFIGLEILGDRNRFDSLDFPTRRAEAASFCGFIMYNYGLDRLFLLMQSKSDWENSLKTIFQMSPADLQKAWLAFAREHSNDPDGLVEDDPVRDLRMLRR